MERPYFGLGRLAAVAFEPTMGTARPGAEPRAAYRGLRSGERSDADFRLLVHRWRCHQLHDRRFQSRAPGNAHAVVAPASWRLAAGSGRAHGSLRPRPRPDGGVRRVGGPWFVSQRDV